MRRTRLVLSLAAALALVASACGEGGGLLPGGSTTGAQQGDPANLESMLQATSDASSFDYEMGVQIAQALIDEMMGGGFVPAGTVRPIQNAEEPDFGAMINGAKIKGSVDGDNAYTGIEIDGKLLFEQASIGQTDIYFRVDAPAAAELFAPGEPFDADQIVADFLTGYEETTGAPAPQQVANLIRAAVNGDWIGITGLDPEKFAESFGGTAELGIPGLDAATGAIEDFQERYFNNPSDSINRFGTVNKIGESGGKTQWSVTLDLNKAADDVLSFLESAAQDLGEPFDRAEAQAEIDAALPEGAEVTIRTLETSGGFLTGVRLDVGDLFTQIAPFDTSGDLNPADLPGMGELVFEINLSNHGGARVSAPGGATTISGDEFLQLLEDAGAFDLLGGGFADPFGTTQEFNFSG